jgi:predicted neuraminidase
VVALETLFDRIGTSGVFARQPPVVLGNGDTLLPIFYCHGRPGEKWVGSFDTSAVRISTDGGLSWREYEVPNSTGCVHMNVEQSPDGSLLALFRSRWTDNTYSSRSSDRGRPWSPPVPSVLPNNNSSIRFTILANGHHALAFNDINGEGVTERRASLYDDIEEDESGVGLKKPAAKSGERSAFWGVLRVGELGGLDREAGALMWRLHVDTAALLADAHGPRMGQAEGSC